MYMNALCCDYPKHYFVIVFMSVGIALSTMLIANLNLAVIEMTSNKTVITKNRTEIIDAEYKWTSVEKGFILSCFEYGLLFTSFTGHIVYKLGGATTLGLCTAVNGLLAIASPLLINLHLYALIFGQVVQGLLLGISICGVIGILTHWAPPEKRVRFSAIYGIGFHIGYAIHHPIYGTVIKYYGWRPIFYISGSLIILWSIVWLLFVRNDPHTDIFISKKEKEYLTREVGFKCEAKVPIPWRKILTSKAVFAYLNQYFVIAWSSYFVVFSFPLYLKDMYNVDIQKIGFLSGLPLACSLLVQPVAAALIDYLRQKTGNPNLVFRWNITLSGVIEMFLLIVIGIWADFIPSIVGFVLITMVGLFGSLCIVVLPSEMAGPYSGVLKSFAMTSSSIGSIISTLVMGFIVSDHNVSQWSCFFIVISIMNLYGVIVFYLFGSGELQSWADLKTLSVT